jgi:hypothetical protein
MAFVQADSNNRVHLPAQGLRSGRSLRYTGIEIVCLMTPCPSQRWTTGSIRGPVMAAVALGAENDGLER